MYWNSSKSISQVLLWEPNITVLIVYGPHDDWRFVRNKLWSKIVGASNYFTQESGTLNNGNEVIFTPLSQTQINAKAKTISLLLFFSSIEYNVRRTAARELYPNFKPGEVLVGVINTEGIYETQEN